MPLAPTDPGSTATEHEGVQPSVAALPLAMELSASAVAVDDPDRSLAEPWRHELLWSRARGISGGASGIMRDLAGHQRLALPRP